MKIAFYTFFLALFLWGLASWVDIVSDNCYPNPEHHPLNMFVIMTENN